MTICYDSQPLKPSGYFKANGIICAGTYLGGVVVPFIIEILLNKFGLRVTFASLVSAFSMLIITQANAGICLVGNGVCCSTGPHSPIRQRSAPPFYGRNSSKTRLVFLAQPPIPYTVPGQLSTRPRKLYSDTLAA